MFKNAVFKKNYYELEHIIECKNCQVLHQDENKFYIKLLDYTVFSQLKQNIITALRKNPELYCDCKKIIYINNSFEEVIEIKKINNETLETLKYYDMKLCVYKVCIQNSYGPLLKCKEYSEVKKEISFLPDPDDYSSDQEINESIQHYAKINQFKEKKVKSSKKNKSKSNELPTVE